MTDEQHRPAVAKWSAITSLSLGVFAIVTAEFLPVSLLIPMADDLAVSEGLAGQSMTATAAMAAVAASAVVIATRNFDRRPVVIALTLLLIASSALTAIASSFAALIVGRLLLGITLGGFWSLAAATALGLAPEQLFARAMTVIFACISAATVLAAPLGAYLASFYGWRAAFLGSAVLGGVALAAQLATLPRVRPVGSPSVVVMLRLLHRPPVWAGLLTVLVSQSGFYSGLTYLRPFLEQVTDLSVGAVSLSLLAFGIGGVLGNLAGGAAAGSNTLVSAIAGAAMLATAAATLFLLGSLRGIAIATVVLWGFAGTWFAVAIATWNTKTAPGDAGAVGALLLIVFQIAVAAGATLGGALMNWGGPHAPVGYAAVAGACGAAVMFVANRSRR